MVQRKRTLSSADSPTAELTPDAAAAPHAAASSFSAVDAGTPQPLDRQLCFSLYSASSLVIRRYRPLLTKLGLTYPQYLVMLALWQRSPATVGELGRQLDLEFGSITPLLQRMETAGLIRRRRDAADERRVIVELTDAGMTLREKTGDLRPAMLCDVNITADELTQLHQSLGRLLAALRPDET